MGTHVRCRHQSSGVPMDFHVNNLDLVPAGRSRIGWAEREMPVLRRIRDRFAAERPLAGMRI
ncbi:MAG TPA: adenosylhomocysteinase, partial [bacterium]|nr:adenosylhomocysteinase [bacterium]